MTSAVTIDCLSFLFSNPFPRTLLMEFPKLIKYPIIVRKLHRSKAAIFNLFHLMAHMDQVLKFCSTPRNIFLAYLKRTGIILIHIKIAVLVVLTFLLDSMKMVIAVLVVVTFLFDSMKKKRSVPLTNSQVLVCLENFRVTTVENLWSKVLNVVSGPASLASPKNFLEM